MSKEDVETLKVRPGQLVSYIEQMLLELAELASGAGETALAASLALTAIQAGAAAERHDRKPLKRRIEAIAAID